MTDHEALEALSKKATQGLWRYRPDEHDDWGIVKSPVLPDGFACVLAQFRDPDALDSETLARHREAKTDPWEANARFIVALVNAYRTGQLIPAPSVDDAMVKRVARAICENLRSQFEQHEPEVLDRLDMTPEYWCDTANAAISAMQVKP